MKGNIKKLTILLIAVAFILILAGSVNAATPTVETVNGKDYFFANGTPITIEELTGGALIKWADDEWAVGSDAIIFGGMHNNDTEVNSSITMNGGTVKHIIGGGLHLSNTKTSTVIINGGTMTSASGGGIGAGAVMGQNCGCTGYNGQQSDCKVGTANVTINGGNVYLVYGAGPSGLSTTNTANVTVTGGKADHVTGGGSNGYTGTANLNITGGNMISVQSINRGTMDNANVKVTGGNIEKLAICGKSESDIDGEITNKVTAEVTGNAEVAKMELGLNAGAAVDMATSTVVKKENVKVAEGTVEDSTAIDNNVTKLNTVKVDDKTYYVEAGKTIKDLAEYATITSKDGYKFLGFKTAQGEWKETDELTNGIELTTSFEKIATSEGAVGEAAPEKDETPKMGSNNIVVYALVAMVSLVAVVAVKKYNA